MKFLKNLLVAVLFLSNILSLHAMEVPGERYVFLTTAISDIQNLAKDMSQDTGYEYQIVTVPGLLKKCLQTLGLNLNSTPLDIRFHYDLLLQNLSINDPLRNVITRAYNQLMMMLLVFNDYQGELQDLLSMDFQQVQTIELEGVTSEYQFLKHKGRVIDSTISRLKKEQHQYVSRNQRKSISDIHALLGLPEAAPSDLVKKAYDVYMEKYSPYKLIALKKISKKNSSYVKEKMLEVEKVKKAYEQYLAER